MNKYYDMSKLEKDMTLNFYIMIDRKKFNRFWKDSTKESILNQFYWDYNEMIRLDRKINVAIEFINNILTFNECDINDIKTIKEILKGGEKNEK